MKDWQKQTHREATDRYLKLAEVDDPLVRRTYLERALFTAQACSDHSRARLAEDGLARLRMQANMRTLRSLAVGAVVLTGLVLAAFELASL